MGMGFAGSQVTSIAEDVIIKKCREELAAFNALKEKHGQFVVYNIVDSNDAGTEVEESEHAAIIKAHDAVVNKFKKKTGLIISYFYHDVANDGDRYDDIGECWIVENAYQLTKEAKPFAKFIHEEHFVMYG